MAVIPSQPFLLDPFDVRGWLGPFSERGTGSERRTVPRGLGEGR